MALLMAKYLCIARIEGGKIQNPKAVKTLFEALKDGKYKVEISPVNTRSLNQNHYYWLIMTDYVQPALYDAGWSDIKNKDAAHEFVKSLFLKTKFTNENSGEVVERIKSTAELTKTEFNEYLEDIWRWAAEYLSITIPAPNEQFALYE
jgi:hypothetical protein